MSSLEAKIVVLGAQGVGKTSLVTRYCKGSFNPAETTSTVGASFMTKRVIDGDTDTVVRLQIWDTAGQERFRSISRLYYRGANACILCYSITDAQSFVQMGAWLTELRRNLPPDIVLHVVGTKADVVARDPSRREVPFERCIAYVAENLAPGLGSTPPPTAHGGLLSTALAASAAANANAFAYSSSAGANSSLAPHGYGYGHGHSHSHSYHGGGATTTATGITPASSAPEPRSPSSKRSSGFWGQEAGWDACHEISAESGEGVEEVFRVVARKLVEQNRKMQQAILAATATSSGGTPGYGDGADSDGYFDSLGGAGAGGAGGATGGVSGLRNGGSFRVGRDRRSWLFPQSFSVADMGADAAAAGTPGAADQNRGQGEAQQSGRCC